MTSNPSATQCSPPAADASSGLHRAARLVPRYTRQVESLMEAFLGILFLMVLNVVFFEDDPGFLKVQPHPFLFLTILIASRYGTFDGFITGVFCALVYIAYELVGHDWSYLVQTIEWHRFIPAYLFVIMGVLLGEIRQMANREVLKMQDQVRRANQKIGEVTRELEMVTRVKDELQAKILTAEDPLSQFYDSAQRITILKPEEAYPAIMDLVEKFTGAEKYGIYLAKERDEGVVGPSPPLAFELRFSRGWSSADEFPAFLTSEHPAIARVVETRRVVAAAGETSDILACAPMLDAAADRVIGLIVIHRIPFVRLTKLTLSHLETIAGWAGKTLAEASRLHEAVQARVDDEETGLFQYAFLAKRLTEETMRVARYGGEMSLVLVKVLGAETLSPEDRRLVLRSFGATLRRLLRTADVVGAHRLPGMYAVILPATSPARAVVVTARINEAFRQQFGGLGSRFAHLSLKMGVAGTSQEHQKTEAELVAEAERLQLT